MSDAVWITEYYVRYVDTGGRKYSSLIFPLRQTAEEFEKAMISQGYASEGIKEVTYPYVRKNTG